MDLCILCLLIDAIVYSLPSEFYIEKRKKKQERCVFIALCTRTHRIHSQYKLHYIDSTISLRDVF